MNDASLKILNTYEEPFIKTEMAKIQPPRFSINPTVRFSISPNLSRKKKNTKNK